MAWTAPVTWVANTVLTAAQLNQQLRDNISETAPAKATTAGSHFAVTAANTIAERQIRTSTVATSAQQTGITGYDLLLTTGGNPSPGPAVTLTTGANALIWINARGLSSVSTGQALASFAVSGASTISESDGRAIIFPGTLSGRSGICVQLATLTPGTNTFTMTYKTANSSHTATFQDRTIVVMGL